MTMAVKSSCCWQLATVTTQSLYSHHVITLSSRWLMEYDFSCVLNFKWNIYLLVTVHLTLANVNQPRLLTSAVLAYPLTAPSLSVSTALLVLSSLFQAADVPKNTCLYSYYVFISHSLREISFPLFWYLNLFI